MSMIVQQPHRRVRPLSGLGAYAQLLPQIRQRGVGALLDADIIASVDVCNYDALLNYVAQVLGARAEYAAHPEHVMNDAALLAHSIWEQYCPQTTVNVEQYYYGSDDGRWGWPGGGHGHHHDHDHHHGGGGGGGGGWGPPAPGGGAAPMHANVMQANMAMRSPSGARAARRAQQATVQAHPAVAAMSPMPQRATMQAHAQAVRMGPSAHSARAAPHAMARGGHRGLGGPLMPGLMPDVRLPATIANMAAPAVVQQVQNYAATRAAPAMAAASTVGTLDPCVDPSTGAILPCDPNVPQCAGRCGQASAAPVSSGTFSIEGALPSGVALLLGAALGLVGASLFVGGK